jgi:hypothetical protein
MRTQVWNELNPELVAHGEIGNGRSSFDNVKATASGSGGNSESYTIRRLKRDRPDLAS